jgi:hypothetical protein
MSILPEGEQLRKAIKWVSDQRIEDPESKLYRLVEEASQEFDLSPKDEEFLVHFFTAQIL